MRGGGRFTDDDGSFHPHPHPFLSLTPMPTDVAYMKQSCPHSCLALPWLHVYYSIKLPRLAAGCSFFIWRGDRVALLLVCFLRVTDSIHVHFFADYAR